MGFELWGSRETFYQPLVQHQLVFRTNLDRRILDDINVSLGFVVFLQSPNDPESESTLMVPELRTDFGFNAKKSINILMLISVLR